MWALLHGFPGEKGFLEVRRAAFADGNSPTYGIGACLFRKSECGLSPPTDFNLKVKVRAFGFSKVIVIAWGHALSNSGDQLCRNQRISKRWSL